MTIRSALACGAAVASLLATVAGCGGAGGGAGDRAGEVRGPGDAARAYAVEVDRARASMSRRTWTSATDGATAELSGFSAGDSLRLIREVLDRGGGMRQASRYYFAGVQLRYYESEETVRASARDTAPAPQNARLVLAFDERGAVVESSYLVNGASTPVEGPRVDAVLARAAEVARQWATAPGGAQPPG